MKNQKTTSVIDYIETVFRWRKFIIRNVIVITLLSILVSFLITKKYTAKATILPPNPEQNMLLGIMAGGIGGGLSGVSSIGAFLPGLSTPSDLYAAIMRSGRIRGEIIRKYDLKEQFGTKTMVDTYRALEEITEIEISPEGIVSVSVTYKDKHLASDVANAYVEELDKFNTQTTMTVGKKYRIFIEQRLKENEDSLKICEEALRDFQSKNRTVALDAEIQAAIETIAQLKSQIIFFEVQKGAWASAGQTDNPYLRNIERELSAMKKQLSKIEFGGKTKPTDEFGAGFSVPFAELPEVSLTYARLIRDVKIQEAIYELLVQQYEQAKIMELKDTPTVQILDRASPPEKKSYPKRSIIVIVAFVSSFALSVFGVFIIEYIREERSKEKSSVSRMAKILTLIKHDFNTFIRKIRR